MVSSRLSSRLVLFLQVSLLGSVMASLGWVRAETTAPTKTLPIPGETFLVDGREAFLIPAKRTNSKHHRTPWVWYAPTLPGLPDKEELWLFTRLTEAGIAIAGIDVGESFGSPAGRVGFSALYEELTQRRNFAARPVLLGRSRGGLMTLNWAAENPDKLAAFAGIYPVCNLASYPGLAKAAPAYDMSAAQLEATLTEHNPIDRLAPLARARIPLLMVHGDVDTLVPLEDNSLAVRSRYFALGGQCRVIVAHGQGHNRWAGFFQNEELVGFVIEHALRAP
jgi:pimeloyl-ACP methyl ester carboxylesterase